MLKERNVVLVEPFKIELFVYYFNGLQRAVKLMWCLHGWTNILKSFTKRFDWSNIVGYFDWCLFWLIEQPLLTIELSLWFRNFRKWFQDHQKDFTKEVNIRSPKFDHQASFKLEGTENKLHSVVKKVETTSSKRRHRFKQHHRHHHKHRHLNHQDKEYYQHKKYYHKNKHHHHQLYLEK